VNNTFEQEAMSAMKLALTPYVDAIRQAMEELGPGASDDMINKTLNTQKFTELAQSVANELTTKMNAVMEQFAPFDNEQKQQQTREAQYTNAIRWENDNTHRNSAGGPNTDSNPRLMQNGANFDGVTPQIDLPDSVQSIEVDFANREELTFKFQLKSAPKFTPAQSVHDKKYTHEFTYKPTPQLRETPRFVPPTPMDDMRRGM
jgi:hypothetical protein